MLAALLPLLLPTQFGERISGIHPELATWNEDNEAGIGAVVPWAGRLWFLTYPPHRPRGSSDRLWSLIPGEAPVPHPASVGGTHAGRLLHAASQQLFLGPYVIDAAGEVKVLSPERMPGRLTGWTPSPWDPEGTVLAATMEEGLYSVDVHTLEVEPLFVDDQGQLSGQENEGPRAELPGYHGKGLAAGQGVVVYSNNGEPGAAAQRDPRVPSGCLAEFDGKSWKVVRRAQFTEVTGPGGIRGSGSDDPIWAVGWDPLSVLLGVREDDQWTFARLPKGSRSYDGAHGWNTEWPRIREIGEGDLLMTMHGLFWRFPSSFGAGARAGLAPRTSYLKVVADFARYGDWIVLGCDDTARSGFLNKRGLHGGIAGPGQSHSNLWFLGTEQLDALGPVLAQGAVWEGADLDEGSVSDPFLLTRLEHRALHASHEGPDPVELVLELDPEGTGDWTFGRTLEVDPGTALWAPLDVPSSWVRVRSLGKASGVTVRFSCAEADARGADPAPLFTGLARRDGVGPVLGGATRVRGGGLRTLALVADRTIAGQTEPAGLYHLTAELDLVKQQDLEADRWHRDRLGVPDGLVTLDEASAVLTDDEGHRWRFPLPLEGWRTPAGAPPARLAREVVTERDLLHVAGTFYELPARNAGGVIGARPIASHPFWIQDFCGYRGLLVLTGLEPQATEGLHMRRAEDGSAGVWVGAVDDLWQLGRPRGRGGPWKDTPVEASTASDPYLIHGFHQRELSLSHGATEPVQITVELDAGGTGQWSTYRKVLVAPGEVARLSLPDALCARWLRTLADRPCEATAQITAR